MKRFITLLLLSFIPLMGCNQDKKQDWDDNDTCGENYVSSNPCSNYHHHSSILPIYLYWWFVMNHNRFSSPYVSRPVFTSNFRGTTLSRGRRGITTTNNTSNFSSLHPSRSSSSSSHSSAHVSHGGGGGRK